MRHGRTGRAAGAAAPFAPAPDWAAADEPEVLDPHRFTYSVVIPVYNSEQIVATTIDRTVAFFESRGFSYELILVNDGSTDHSWDLLKRAATHYPHVYAANLLRNYGQHNANLCGFRRATGDYVITMDDDLQNPPEEIIHLIEKAMTGPDVVFGQFRQQGRARRTATSAARSSASSTAASSASPPTSSSATSASSGATSWTGSARRAARTRTSPARRSCTRAARPTSRSSTHRGESGKSNYSPLRIAKLVLRILFSYSLFPLRLSAAIGALISVLSFAIGIGFMVRRFLGNSRVEGVTTIIVLLSFLNGVIILMLSMLGEYVLRTLRQVTETESYHVLEELGSNA